MNAKRLTLVGAGGFGRELVNWVEDATQAGRLPALTGFLDRDRTALDGFAYGLSYRGTPDDYRPEDGELLVMSIGDPVVKLRVAHELKERGGVFATVVHPSAVLARSALLGEGVVVCPYALISADARVGDFVAINGFSSVGHDAIVGDGSTLSAHVDLTGGVSVGEACFFGSGAKVLPGVRIGDRARIGAGAIVMRNVRDDVTMFAAPAKKL